MKIFLFLLLISILASSCGILSPRRIQPPNAKFKGIRHSTDSENVVNVLLIHGMGRKKNTHYDKLSRCMARELGYEYVQTKQWSYPTEPWLKQLNLHPGQDLSAQSYFRIMEFRDPKNQEKVLRFCSLVWSPVTEASKRWLLKLDDDPRRALLNVFLKKKVMTDGFSDAVIYLNPVFNEYIRINLGFAMAHMEADDPMAATLSFEDPSKGKNIIISASLGSKMLWDMFHKGVDSLKYFTMPPGFEDIIDFHSPPDSIIPPFLPPHTIERFASKVEGIYMLSNQLPLIGMVGFQPNTSISADTLNNIAYFDWYKQIQDFIETKNGNRPQLVVFNDPNDLLGFRIPIKANNKDMVLVSMKVALFDFLHLIAEPGSAHTRIDKSARARRLIANGLIRK